jgi:hypothetical protein
MSQTLILELSDKVYAALQRQAEATGTSPDRLAAKSLELQFATEISVSEKEIQAARHRFERHFGAIDLGRATGADNESIDEDLAREAGENHEAR